MSFPECAVHRVNRASTDVLNREHSNELHNIVLNSQYLVEISGIFSKYNLLYTINIYSIAFFEYKK